MDKFAFKDIVFNVGARVDVFDANQPILKDPYLFYNALTVKELEFLLNMLRESTLKGDQVELFYNLAIKIQNQYIKQSEK